MDGARGDLAMGSGSETQLWTLPSTLHLPSLDTAFPPEGAARRVGEPLTRQQAQSMDIPL